MDPFVVAKFLIEVWGVVLMILEGRDAHRRPALNARYRKLEQFAID